MVAQWPQNPLRVASKWPQSGLNVVSEWSHSDFRGGLNVVSKRPPSGLGVVSSWSQDGLQTGLNADSNVGSKRSQSGLNVVSEWSQSGLGQLYGRYLNSYTYIFWATGQETRPRLSNFLSKYVRIPNRKLPLGKSNTGLKTPSRHGYKNKGRPKKWLSTEDSDVVWRPPDGVQLW